jgi:hypothetical protein
MNKPNRADVRQVRVKVNGITFESVRLRRSSGAVKVVNVEDKPSVWSLKGPQILNVRIATKLRINAATWEHREIGSHDGNGAPIEPKGRSGRRCFGLRCREISDGSDHLPECTLHIHRDRRRSLWTPFRLCSAPSVPILGLATAVRGGHLQLDHGWNSAQSKTYGCNHCVKLAAIRSSPQVQIL